MSVNYSVFTNKYFIALFFVLFSSSYVVGQSRLNFGLTQPQRLSAMPAGLSPADKPVLKTKSSVSFKLIRNEQGNYDLNKGWELADANTVTASRQSIFDVNYKTTNWYNAVVPGTVLTTLVEQGVYPDPYIGLNNMSIPEELCRKEWWYRIAFSAPVGESGKLAWLHLNGINYKADVWLNGKMIGSMKGAFVRGIFNVTGLLQDGKKNVLAVHIYPPPNPGIPHEQSRIAGMGPNGGQLALDGPTFISSEGWDWVPGIRDRNIGIWQGVHLRYTGSVTIADPQVVCDLPLPDTTHALITIKAMVKNNTEKQQSVQIKGTIGGVNVQMHVQLNAGENKLITFSPSTHALLKMADPKLWWPNGYGNQHLYKLELQVVDQRQMLSDRQEVRFGIRELSYELMVDAPHRKGARIEYSPVDLDHSLPLFDNVKRREYEKRIFIPALRDGVDSTFFKSLPGNNPFLVIKVNGQSIFCRGGNWGMDDGMKRVNRDRLEPSFRLHKEANFNMIRNWTGESTEEVFYELADEYGMLVWNDFWMSTEGYNLAPLDNRLLLENSLETIRRFRNHPSIAIWCPRNEGYAPVEIEDELYMQISKEDGTRHYIGNSREINLRPSGDWHYIADPALYFTKYADGFSTEIGTFSVPVASTLKKFIKPADQWPINDVWHYHDLHSNNQNLEGYLRAVDSLYGKPKSIDEFAKKVQLVNYDSHRAIFEAWNSKMWDRTSGVLLWMTHPAWPSMIWQTYSWDYETHGSFFGAKKACEPVHVQMNLSDNKVIAINTTVQPLAGLHLIYTVYDLKGSILSSEKRPVNIAANSKTEIFTPQFTSLQVNDAFLVRLLLTDMGGKVLSENSYWKTPEMKGDFLSLATLAEASLFLTRKSAESGYWKFELVNTSAVPAIGIKCNLADGSGNILLPAYFSDGYFTLLPGERKEIEIRYPGDIKNIKIRTEGLNSQVQFYSFE